MSRFALFFIVAILLITLVGCSNPLTNKENINVVKTSEKDNTISKNIMLYFPDDENKTLITENRKVKISESTITNTVLNELLKGSKSGKKIFPDGTKILSSEVKAGIVNLNLSKEFISGSSSSSTNEALIIYSIVNSLTEINNVKGVQFLINGKKSDMFKAFNISGVINRNLDVITSSETQVKSGNYKTKVTLYFVDPKKSDYEFTKEIREIEVINGEIAKAIFNELLKGSKTYGRLIPDGTKIISLNLKDNKLIMDLSKEFITNDHLGSGFETMMVYSIVNTMTELSSIKQVQFLIEGKVTQTNQHMSISEPFKRNLTPIGQDNGGSTSVNNEQTLLQNKGKEILKAIRNKDMQKFASYLNPNKGIRFTPYSYVNLKKDKVFTVDKIKTILSDPNKYTFGSYDGTGEPIILTFQDYYNKFIYDCDFLNAKQIGYNKIIGTGNTSNNVFTAYPGCIMIEYHFPGFDAKYQGMDWRSLRLVFEKKSSTWYLVGIIHDQWTI